jgi:hypothetical protein
MFVMERHFVFFAVRNRRLNIIYMNYDYKQLMSQYAEAYGGHNDDDESSLFYDTVFTEYVIWLCMGYGELTPWR